MKSTILKILKKHHIKSIALFEIKQKMPGDTSDIEFNKEKLKADYIKQIHALQRQISSGIDLKEYLKQSEDTWKKDVPWIKQIDAYLKEKGLPQEEATSAERSYALTQNEKWIDEEEGRKLLERINLWDKMKISKYPDPLMIAVNRESLSEKNHKHLIVENKSTYYLLVDGLKETNFTSLIYGCGWKVVAGLEGIYKQLGIEEDESTFYYSQEAICKDDILEIWRKLECM